MESCRPHYAATWPPVLHAAALWLNATGFKTDKQNESGTDKFHLLFGMSLTCCVNLLTYFLSIFAEK